jgi:hypothetical protein
MSEQTVNPTLPIIKLKKGRRLGKKTKTGNPMGRPRKPIEERKTASKQELVIEKKTRKHRIDDNDLVRRSILGLAKLGKTTDEIADFVGVSRSYLNKNYMREIRSGRELANALVVENLYQQAMKDAPSSIQAGIYLTKARMGWDDKKPDEGSKQPAVVFDFSDMSYEERLNLMEKIKMRKEFRGTPPTIIDEEVIDVEDE